MFKKQKSILEFLSEQKLSDPFEQSLIDESITLIKNKENPYQVRARLIRGFRALALKNKLSKEGLAFFTELQKPNRQVDTALSSMTWFTN